MDWWAVILDTYNTSISTILKMLYVVIPLLILIECLKDGGILEKISSRAQGVTKLLRLPGEAALGLVVGIFVGLIFGSGVIMQTREDVEMTRTQLNVLFIFLGLCHAVVEETILFTAIGAQGAVILISRIIVAVLFCFSYIWISRWMSGFRNNLLSGKM